MHYSKFNYPENLFKYYLRLLFKFFRQFIKSYDLKQRNRGFAIIISFFYIKIYDSSKNLL